MNNQEEEQPEVKPSPEVHVALVDRDLRGETVNVEFSNGVFTVPAHVVQQVGGVKELERLAPELIEFTFEEFLADHNEEVSSNMLNRFQSEFMRRNARFR